jgi:branched-chain amino acid transport system ATP-binding protein
MVAIGRALMSNPRVLLCDELSLGLAPIVIKEIYDALPAICAEGMSAVIVEQDVAMAQRVSQRIYCFQEGRVSLQGASGELTREQISQAYFGMPA